MPLVRLPQNTIITTLYCPLCEGVGRLYRKPEDRQPKAPEGCASLAYTYTLLCPQCGEIELWGEAKGRRPAAEAASS